MYTPAGIFSKYPFMDFFEFGLKERPYPGCVLISFWCDYDNKKLFIFSRFRILSDISNLITLAIIKIWQCSYTAQIVSSCFRYDHWLLTLCGAGGDASFSPQTNLIILCF